MRQALARSFGRAKRAPFGLLKTGDGEKVQLPSEYVSSPEAHHSSFGVNQAKSSPPAAALDPREQLGVTLAKVDCAKCHAISKVGDSPLREAPPFRTLHQRYPIEDLAKSLAEGISTGHPAMPEWRLDPGQIGDLIAYLKTLE